MLALRKARGIVRFWKGWWSDNPSGSRTNFFGRQHLTFDKGGKCGGAKQGIVQKISLMVGMGSNHHHSWLGLTEQQKFTFGEASLVRSEGVLSFCNGCEGSNIRCNGRQSLRLDGKKFAT